MTLTAMRLPSCKCPARLAASLATPSIKQPSPVNTTSGLEASGAEARAEQTVGVVVDQVEAILVVHGAEVSLCNGKADRVGEALAKGTGGDLDTCTLRWLGT